MNPAGLPSGTAAPPPLAGRPQEAAGAESVANVELHAVPAQVHRDEALGRPRDGGRAHELAAELAAAQKSSSSRPPPLHPRRASRYRPRMRPSIALKPFKAFLNERRYKKGVQPKSSLTHTAMSVNGHSLGDGDGTAGAGPGDTIM